MIGFWCHDTSHSKPEKQQWRTQEVSREVFKFTDWRWQERDWMAKQQRDLERPLGSDIHKFSAGFGTQTKILCPQYVTYSHLEAVILWWWRISFQPSHDRAHHIWFLQTSKFECFQFNSSRSTWTYWKEHFFFSKFLLFGFSPFFYALLSFSAWCSYLGIWEIQGLQGLCASASVESNRKKPHLSSRKHHLSMQKKLGLCSGNSALFARRDPGFCSWRRGGSRLKNSNSWEAKTPIFPQPPLLRTMRWQQGCWILILGVKGPA